MMKFLIALFLTLSVSAHCPIKFETENLCANLEWTNGPVLNELSAFEVVFWKEGDSSHTFVSPQNDVEFMSWMVMSSGMEHGGPAMNWEEVEAGVFQVNDARFFMHGMKGYWQVKVQLTKGTELVEEQAVRVSFE